MRDSTTSREQCDDDTMNLNNRILLALAVATFAIAGSGCGGDQNAATEELVKQQQTQIEQMQQQIDALKTNQTPYTPGVASTSGGCDRGVEQTATKRGGERFAAGDFNKAILYYNDALTASPSDDRAEVNAAGSDDARGNNAAAIK